MSEGFLMRVKYAKRGRLAYLSHLETVRSVERIVRRAQLPYAVTEGFNPHMKIAFGPALPVGAGGLGEYVDVRLREYVPAAKALERMVAMSAPNLRPVECAYIDTRSEAITVAYPVSSWEARLDASVPVERLRRAFADLLEVGHIEVVRKRKKPKTVEFEGRLVGAPRIEERDGRVVVSFATRDTGAGALRPDKFIEAATAPLDPAPRLVGLTRLELLAERA